jgi:hypothetical protein
MLAISFNRFSGEVPLLASISGKDIPLSFSICFRRIAGFPLSASLEHESK